MTPICLKKHLWQLCIKWINQICSLKIYENKKVKNSFYIFGYLLELSIESNKLLFVFWQLGNPTKHMFCHFEKKKFDQMPKTHHKKNHWNDELLHLSTIEVGCALYSIILFHTFIVATQLELCPSPPIVLSVPLSYWCFILHQISLVGFNYILFVSLERHFNCSQAL